VQQKLAIRQHLGARKYSVSYRIVFIFLTPRINLQSMRGSTLVWADAIRYLGGTFCWYRYFKCSIDYAKRSFYRAVNSTLGKTGRIPSIWRICTPAR